MRCSFALSFAVLTLAALSSDPGSAMAASPAGSTTLDVCRVGQFGDPVGTIGDETTGGTIYFGEGDTYWTFLDVRPDSCPGCGTDKLATLSTAHLALYFPFAPETVTVRVSVVGTVPLACHYPNYEDPNAIVCAPFEVTFDCQDPLTTVDFGFPIPPLCRIQTPPGGPGNAFLGFEFVTASDTSQFHKPLLTVQAAARTCMSWNPVGDIPFDMVLEYLTGNPVMYATISKCVSTVGVAPRDPTAAFRLGPAFPNPFFGRVAFTVSQDRGGNLDVGVFDVRGARVRSLHQGYVPAGVHSIEWDGRDASGRTASAGVYFLRASSESQTLTQRLLRMR
jgi:hypothetical protein